MKILNKDSIPLLLANAQLEAERAIEKYPQPNYTIAKVAEETGEFIKAYIHHVEGRDCDRDSVVAEAQQAIAMIIRVLIDGDETIWLNAHHPLTPPPKTDTV